MGEMQVLLYIAALALIVMGAGLIVTFIVQTYMNIGYREED